MIADPGRSTPKHNKEIRAIRTFFWIPASPHCFCSWFLCHVKTGCATVVENGAVRTNFQFERRPRQSHWWFFFILHVCNRMVGHYSKLTFFAAECQEKWYDVVLFLTVLEAECGMERYKNAIILHLLRFSWIKPLSEDINIFCSHSQSRLTTVLQDFQTTHSGETEFHEWFGRVMVNGNLWSCLPITKHNVTGEMEISLKKYHTQG